LAAAQTKILFCFHDTKLKIFIGKKTVLAQKRKSGLARQLKFASCSQLQEKPKDMLLLQFDLQRISVPAVSKADSLQD
jgi:hypothetical protein